MTALNLRYSYCSVQVQIPLMTFPPSLKSKPCKLLPRVPAILLWIRRYRYSTFTFPNLKEQDESFKWVLTGFFACGLVFISNTVCRWAEPISLYELTRCLGQTSSDISDVIIKQKRKVCIGVKAHYSRTVGIHPNYCNSFRANYQPHGLYLGEGHESVVRQISLEWSNFTALFAD